MFDHLVVMTDSELDAHLPFLDTKTILAEAFAALKRNEAVQPPQTLALFPGQRGDFITYLGIVGPSDVFGAKLSPYIADGSKPVITAWTILFSMKTGLPLILCDSARLTRERTAATTALAVDKLASPEASVLAVIGSGALAEAHLRHVKELRDWQEVRLFSPHLADHPERLRGFQKFHASIKPVLSSQTAVAGADVIMLVTSSAKPVIDFKDITAKALVTSISTNAYQAHEIEPAALAQMRVYCDYALTTPGSAGEMVLAAAQGLWSPNELEGDLGDLCVGKVPDRAQDSRPIFFRSIGLGLEDVAIANALYQRVKVGN
ncbi:MAG: ornithine cyclodeaminase family protein [Deltaproteobacteria bacterium]|nr:ornithine cyclodeaminase family protein [Deltaproteobacteria bacterium]